MNLQDLVAAYFPEPHADHYRMSPVLVVLGGLTILLFGFPGALLAYSSDSLAVLACSASSFLLGAACIGGAYVQRGRGLANDLARYAHRRAELLAGRVKLFEIIPGPSPLLSVTLTDGDDFLLGVPMDECVAVRRAFEALGLGAERRSPGAHPELEDIADLYLRTQSRRPAFVISGFKRIEAVDVTVAGVYGGRTLVVTLADDSQLELAVAPYDLPRVQDVLASHTAA